MNVTAKDADVKFDSLRYDISDIGGKQRVAVSIGLTDRVEFDLNVKIRDAVLVSESLDWMTLKPDLFGWAHVEPFEFMPEQWELRNLRLTASGGGRGIDASATLDLVMDKVAESPMLEILVLESDGNISARARPQTKVNREWFTNRHWNGR